MLLVEDVYEVAHHALIKVFSTKVRVPTSGQHFEHATVDPEERHVEGTPAEIVHEDVRLLFALLVQAIRNGCRRRLIDDPQNGHARNDASVLRCLPLSVGEVRWDRDHSVPHWLSDVSFGGLFHLREHHRRYLLGGEMLFLTLDVHSEPQHAVNLEDLVRQQLHVGLNALVSKAPADQPFHVEDRLRWCDSGLVFRSVADEPLLIVEGHVGGSDTVPLVVRYDLDRTVLVDSNARIRGAQIDADHGTVDLLRVPSCQFAEGDMEGDDKRRMATHRRRWLLW
mmetsp:Transcript_109287/g.308371  ORF Transcript_109287/g.308371 Transcript_109287/m.308371 type:complete len:281 (+) Transcript_109287:1286-2128(+)